MRENPPLGFEIVGSALEHKFGEKLPNLNRMRVFALVPLEQMFGEKLPNLNRMRVFALVPLEQKFGEKLPNLNRMRVFVYPPCNKRSANLSHFELVYQESQKMRLSMQKAQEDAQGETWLDRVH